MVGLVGACGLGLQGLEDGPPGGDGGPSTADGGDETSPGGGNPEGGSTDGGTGSNDGPQPKPDAASGLDASPIDSSQSDVHTGAPDTGGPPCTTADGCYLIPPNWQLAAVAGNRAAACPSGFAATPPQDLDEGPDAAGACTCTCSIMADPTCPTGPIGVAFDELNSPGAGLCGELSTAMANDPAGGCDNDLSQGNPPSQYSSLDVEYTPPAATGGQCSSAGTGSGNVTYASQRRACVPDSEQSAGCVGNQCTLTLAAPYRVCIVRSGAQTCPGAPFTEQHTVGSGTSFSCSTCGCSLTASCEGTMRLFMDGNCKQPELDIPADAQCHDPNAPNGTYNSYIYLANPPEGVACTTTPSTAQNVALLNEQTLCCTP
jgi:hypothetical protein